MMFCFGGFWYNECMGPGAVGMRAYAHKRNGTKHDIARISHRIRSNLQLFLSDIAPNLLILHTPQ